MINFVKKNIVLLILLFNFIVQITVHLYLFFTNNYSIPVSPDAAYYIDISNSIRNLSPTTSIVTSSKNTSRDIGYEIMPGYPLLITPFFGNLHLISLFQTILFSIGLVLLFKTLKNKYLFVFVILNLVWIILSTSWSYHNQALVESPTISLLLILIYFLDKYFTEFNQKDFILFSIFFAILISVNNRYIFHFCGIIPFFIFLNFFEKRIKIKHILVGTFVVFLILLPWEIRQYIVYDRLILLAAERTDLLDTRIKLDKNQVDFIKISEYQEYLKDSLNHPLRFKPEEREIARKLYLERQERYKRDQEEINKKKKLGLFVENQKIIYEPYYKRLEEQKQLETKILTTNENLLVDERKKKIFFSRNNQVISQNKSISDEKNDNKIIYIQKKRIDTSNKETQNKVITTPRNLNQPIKESKKDLSFKDSSNRSIERKIHPIDTSVNNSQKIKDTTLISEFSIQNKNLLFDNIKNENTKDTNEKFKTKVEDSLLKSNFFAQTNIEEHKIEDTINQIQVRDKSKTQINKAPNEKKRNLMPKKENIQKENYVEKSSSTIFDTSIIYKKKLDNIINNNEKIDFYLNIDTLIIVKVKKNFNNKKQDSNNKLSTSTINKQYFLILITHTIDSNKLNSSFNHIKNIDTIGIKIISKEMAKGRKPNFVEYEDDKAKIIISLDSNRVEKLKISDFSNENEFRKFDEIRIRKMVPTYLEIVDAILKFHPIIVSNEEKLTKFLNDFSFGKYKQLVYNKFEPSNQLELLLNRFLEHFIFLKLDFILTPQWNPRIHIPSYYQNYVYFFLDLLNSFLLIINIIPLIIAIYKRDFLIITLFCLILLHIILHSLVAGIGHYGRYRLTIFPVWITFAVYGYDQITRYIIKVLKNREYYKQKLLGFIDLKIKRKYKN